MADKTPDRKRGRRGRKPEPLLAEGFLGRLGQRIRDIRDGRLGLTIGEAALRTGGLVSESSWGEYERGAEPGLTRFLAICNALEVSLATLLRGL